MRRAGETRHKDSLARIAVMLAAIVLAVVAGCTIQLEPPKLEVTTEPAYPSRYVLIPYDIRGDESSAQARWSLRRYRPDLDEWELDRTWETVVPSGSSALLQLDNLSDGRYELTGELLTSRGGLSSSASTLTSQTAFYVDTRSPWGGIDVTNNQGGPPYDPALRLEVYPSFRGTVDPDSESPGELYYVLDSTAPPTPDDETAEAMIVMWEDAVSPTQNRVLSIVAIDQAGNVGSRSVEIYTAP